MTIDDVRLVERDKIHLAGIAKFGEPGKIDPCSVWNLFGKIADEIPWVRQKKELYGLELYSPHTVKPFGYTYFCGVEIEHTQPTPPLMLRKDIPPAKYAVLQVNGGVSGFGTALKFVYDQWLPQSDCEIAFPFDFELYDNVTDPEVVPSDLSVWIPVKDKANSST